MRKLILLVLAACFLAACTPSEGSVQTAIAQTAAAQPTATETQRPTSTTTSTPTSTPTITPTWTPSPTETPVPTKTRTPTSTPLPALSEVLISAEELNQVTDVWMSPGLTQPIDSCVADCVGVIWIERGAGKSNLLVYLYEVINADQGARLRNNIISGNKDKGFQEYAAPAITTLPSETWFGANGKKEVYIITQFDKIVLIFYLNNPSGFINAEDGIVVAALYTQLQIEKLKKAGY